jgi:Leucine-rich repeat (LRR) protein
MASNDCNVYLNEIIPKLTNNAVVSDFVKCCPNAAVPIMVCDSDRNIIELSITGEAALLTGFISPSIGKLSKLQALRVNNNALKGEIPAEMDTLPNLKTIVLTGNQFSSSASKRVDAKGALIDEQKAPVVPPVVEAPPPVIVATPPAPPVIVATPPAPPVITPVVVETPPTPPAGKGRTSSKVLKGADKAKKDAKKDADKAAKYAGKKGKPEKRQNISNFYSNGDQATFAATVFSFMLISFVL